MNSLRRFGTTVLASCVLVLMPIAHAAKQPENHLGVDAFLSCRPKVGYVLVFRLVNQDPSAIDIPEDLLPWSPSGSAMKIILKPKLNQSLSPSGIIAERFGRVRLQPQQELIGEVRLSLLFSAQQIDAALANGDAILQWKYKPRLGDVETATVAGDIRLLGKSFYAVCRSKGL